MTAWLIVGSIVLVVLCAITAILWLARPVDVEKMKKRDQEDEDR